jgi:D-glycero-alpha-D-manno-heptose-7-phosphate kinase
MIVTRTSVRLPLGGGGTDLPWYANEHGGFLLGAAIDKYVYVIVKRRFERSIRVSYSKTEIVDTVDQVQHPRVREALKLLGIDQGIEIVSLADVPANTGLGTSSSFTVGVLNALHAYRGEFVSLSQLAEEACQIEINSLAEPIGKQDQYLAALGGVTCLEIARDGTVTASPLALCSDTREAFETNTLLFYTGIRREASQVLSEQRDASGQEKERQIEQLHRIKEIGRAVQRCFLSGDLDEFGRLLHAHWQAKRGISAKISESRIDRWYEIARANGALGGKLMGAGGGGFLMFYCNGTKQKLRSVMEKEGLREMRFRIEPNGSKVLVNL